MTMTGNNKSVVVLDLEFLAATNRNQFPAITEIAAVKYDRETGESDEYHTFVQLPGKMRLSSLDRKITGMDMKDLTGAPEPEEAFEKLNRFCAGCRVYAWGPNDARVLLKNYGSINMRLQFYVNDAQQEFQKKLRLSDNHLISVEDAVIHTGGTFEGRKHSALDDARNTAKIVRYIKP
jgi:inhibitor of KinA sporulation pathway (predicted exonuclease)